MRSLAPIALLGSFLLVTAAQAQSLAEHAAAASGATIGTAAGKPLSNAITKIFGQTDTTTKKAASASVNTRRRPSRSPSRVSRLWSWPLLRVVVEEDRFRPWAAPHPRDTEDSPRAAEPLNTPPSSRPLRWLHTRSLHARNQPPRSWPASRWVQANSNWSLRWVRPNPKSPFQTMDTWCKSASIGPKASSLVRSGWIMAR